MIIDNVYIPQTCKVCGEPFVEHDEGCMYCPFCSDNEDDWEDYLAGLDENDLRLDLTEDDEEVK